jgi:hypothetical protein
MLCPPPGKPHGSKRKARRGLLESAAVAKILEPSSPLSFGLRALAPAHFSRSAIIGDADPAAVDERP